MPQHIEVPGMGIVEFPDNMSDEQIVTAIKNNSQGQNAPRGTGALSQLAQGIKDIPSNIVSSGNNAVNFAKGASESLVNLPAQALNVALPKGMQLPTFQNTGEGTAYKVGKFGGDIASFLGGGEALDTARAASEAIPYAGKVAKSLGKQSFTGTIARQALGGALYGAATNPEDKGMGAAIGGSLGGIGGALGEGINALRPSRLFRGKLTPEQLQNNANIAGNTQTSLGDVIQSPTLKAGYENYISKVPLSGADEAMLSTAGHITEKGNQIVNGYLKDTRPEEVNTKIGDALKNAYSQQQAEKTALYNKVNSLAKEKDLKLDLPTFSKTANKYSELINNQNFLKFDPDAKALLSKISNYKNTAPMVNESQRSVQDVLSGSYPKKYPTLEETNILAGKLNNQAKSYRESPSAEDRNTANILSELGRSLKSDIKNTINESGDKELKEEFTKAEENYKNNFSPFLDKDIYKFLGGNKSPDELLSSFIKTGSTTDKGAQLNKLMSKLPQDAKDLVKYSYFSRAMRGGENDRTIDPNALKTLWNDTKLGPNQKKALMPNPEERRMLDNYTKLVGMNSEPLSAMFNPKTGQRNIQALQGLLGIGVGAVTGVGGLGTAAGGVLGAKYLTKQLTNPAVRRRLVNEMTNPTKLKGGGMTQAIAQALASTLQGGQ